MSKKQLDPLPVFPLRLYVWEQNSMVSRGMIKSLTLVEWCKDWKLGNVGEREANKKER
jgi:hypothetical protein